MNYCADLERPPASWIAGIVTRLATSSAPSSPMDEGSYIYMRFASSRRLSRRHVKLLLEKAIPYIYKVLAREYSASATSLIQLYLDRYRRSIVYMWCYRYINRFRRALVIRATYETITLVWRHLSVLMESYRILGKVTIGICTYVCVYESTREIIIDKRLVNIHYRNEQS